MDLFVKIVSFLEILDRNNRNCHRQWKGRRKTFEVSLKMGILSREQLFTLLENTRMFTFKMSHVKCQNISISHISSNTIRNVFSMEKKVTPKNTSVFFSFISPLETIECFALFFFFIQSYNIKNPSIFCLWWATPLSHFLCPLSQPFGWKNLIGEWTLTEINATFGFRILGG